MSFLITCWISEAVELSFRIAKFRALVKKNGEKKDRPPTCHLACHFTPWVGHRKSLVIGGRSCETATFSKRAGENHLTAKPTWTPFFVRSRLRFETLPSIPVFETSGGRSSEIV
eukprot:g61747.t1